MAVCNHEGALLASLCGPVPPHLPQTSPMAEHMALAKLAEVAAGRVEAMVDYTGLVQNFQPGGAHWAMQPSRPMAGLVRRAHMAKGWPAIVGITKVKAHQKLQDLAVGTEDWKQAVGNSLADEAAKAGAAMHHEVPCEVVQAHKRQADMVEGFLVYSAKLHAAWPQRPKACRRPKEASAQARAERAIQHSGASREAHEWLWMPDRSRWYCLNCLGPRRAVKVRARSKGCPGFSLKMRQVFSPDSTHTLLAYDNYPGFLVICVACGAWADREAKALLQPCMGVPTRRWRYDLSCVARGRHPKTRAPLGRGIAVRSQHLLGAG